MKKKWDKNELDMNNNKSELMNILMESILNEIMCFANGNAIVAERRCQILHG